MLGRFVIQLGERLCNQRHGTIRAPERACLTNHPDMQVGGCSCFLLCILSLPLDRMEWLGRLLLKYLQYIKRFMLHK